MLALPQESAGQVQRHALLVSVLMLHWLAQIKVCWVVQLWESVIEEWFGGWKGMLWVGDSRMGGDGQWQHMLHPIPFLDQHYSRLFGFMPAI